MVFLSQYFTTILIVMLSLLVVNLKIGITSIGRKRFGPVFKNKVMRGRMNLQGLVVWVLALLILAKSKKRGAINW